MSARRVGGVALALLVAGCAGGPEAPPGDPGARPLAGWWAEPPAEEVAAFLQRFSSFEGAPACQRELARGAPELAHALLLGPSLDGDDGAATRAALAAALDAIGPATAGAPHAARERARTARPLDHARARERLARARAALATRPEEAAALALEAAAELQALGDPLTANEAAALARAADPGDPRPADAAPSVALAVRWALLAPGEATARGADPRRSLAAAFELASLVGDATTLEHLHGLRQALALDASLVPETDWLRALTKAALRRRRPLPALRHAVALSAAWARDARGAGGLEALRDRLLVAQAHLLQGAHDPALEVALEVAASAEARGAPASAAAGSGAPLGRVEGSARALAGDALLALGRPDAALASYQRAGAAFTRAGDPAGAWRQGLNAAVAELRLRRPARGLAHLGPAMGDAVTRADLEARRDVLLTLAAVRAGERTGEVGADEVEAALARAAAAGALEVVEQHRALPGKLRDPG